MQILSRFWYLFLPVGVIIPASILWAVTGSQAAAERKATQALLTTMQTDVTAPDLVFVGWGEDPAKADASDLVFVGWGDDVAKADATDLVFVGWGGEGEKAEATDLVFVGWGGDGAKADATDLVFVGWGGEGTKADATDLVFVGLGPKAVIIDRFDTGTHGWTSSDGAEAIGVSASGTLCVWDVTGSSTFLTPPDKFLGDWGGRGGELSFRVYYQGTVQWPIVVTLKSPHGQAVRRETLNAYNDKAYEDVTMPIDDIWWEETGDWNDIIANVEGISIEFDIKDGRSEEPEGCIDDFKLVKGHRG